MAGLTFDPSVPEGTGEWETGPTLRRFTPAYSYRPNHHGSHHRLPFLHLKQPERHQMSFRKVPILSSEIAMLPMPPIGVSLQMVVTDEAGNFYRWPLTAYELTSVGE